MASSLRGAKKDSLTPFPRVSKSAPLHSANSPWKTQEERSDAEFRSRAAGRKAKNRGPRAQPRDPRFLPSFLPSKPRQSVFLPSSSCSFSASSSRYLLRFHGLIPMTTMFLEILPFKRISRYLAVSVSRLIVSAIHQCFQPTSS